MFRVVNNVTSAKPCCNRPNSSDWICTWNSRLYCVINFVCLKRLCQGRLILLDGTSPFVCRFRTHLSGRLRAHKLGTRQSDRVVKMCCSGNSSQEQSTGLDIKRFRKNRHQYTRKTVLATYPIACVNLFSITDENLSCDFQRFTKLWKFVESIIEVNLTFSPVCKLTCTFERVRGKLTQLEKVVWITSYCDAVKHATWNQRRTDEERKSSIITRVKLRWRSSHEPASTRLPA